MNVLTKKPTPHGDGEQLGWGEQRNHRFEIDKKPEYPIGDEAGTDAGDRGDRRGE